MKLIALSVLTLTASLNVFASTLAEDRNEITAAYQTLSTLNADLSCQTDADCDSLPVGSRACGGPDGYIAISNLNAKLTEVKVKATQITQMQAEFNMKHGMMSICSFEMPPAVSCQAQVCTAQ